MNAEQPMNDAEQRAVVAYYEGLDAAAAEMMLDDIELALGKLVERHEHYADMGPHAGEHFVTFSGYVTAQELTRLRSAIKHGRTPHCPHCKRPSEACESQPCPHVERGE